MPTMTLSISVIEIVHKAILLSIKHILNCNIKKQIQFDFNNVRNNGAGMR